MSIATRIRSSERSHYRHRLADLDGCMPEGYEKVKTLPAVPVIISLNVKTVLFQLFLKDDKRTVSLLFLGGE